MPVRHWRLADTAAHPGVGASIIGVCTLLGIGTEIWDGENKLLDIRARRSKVREDLAKLGPSPRDGDGYVVGEEVLAHEGMVHGGG